MEEAIVVLEKAEAVLMKRIRAMRDGSPKWAASKRLNEIRNALKALKYLNRDAAVYEQEEEEYLKAALTINPPLAQA